MQTPEYDLEIIAGQCSFANLCVQLDELQTLADIEVPDGSGGTKQALSALRFCTAKSCTEKNPEKIGLDAPVLNQMMRTHTTGIPLPSVPIAKRLMEDTRLGIGAEIMVPHLQMPHYESFVPPGMLVPWIPASVALGWFVEEVSGSCAENEWEMYIKNPKWLGTTLEEAERPESNIVTPMERAWNGMGTYVVDGCRYGFIGRGVDIPEKGDHRNAFTYESAKRMKMRHPNKKMGIDLNHAFGHTHRDEIAPALIEAMKIMVNSQFLFNVLLGEVGTSTTDEGQHMTVPEFRDVVMEVSTFRKLRGPLIAIQ